MPYWVEEIEKNTNDICDTLNERFYPSVAGCVALQVVFAEMVLKRICDLMRSRDFQKKFERGSYDPGR